MADANDNLLIQEYADRNSESAFAALVQRHINLVYSVAFRYVGNSQDAQDVTQAVFVVLARKAGNLRGRNILTGWLYETARLTASQLLRTNARQKARDREAYMQSILDQSGNDTIWRQLAPHLEAAMSRLRAADRELLALRFYENKTGAEAAALLGIGAEAAHKRTNRALDKLRKFFLKRGIDSTAATIAEQISAHSVQAVPVALAKAVTAVALANGAAASASTLTLIKGALKIMAWTKAKTTIVTGAIMLLAVGTTTVTFKEIRAHRPPIWQQKWDMAMIDKLPPQVAILPSLPSTISSGLHVAGRIRNGKMHGLGQSIPDMVMAAYGYQLHLAQLSFSSAIPEGKYDYIANFPTGQQEALQAELKRKFGVAGHLETNEVNCLLLEVKSRNVPGLKRSSLPFSGSEQDDSYSAHHQVLWPLVDYLAEHLGTVVIDHTRLSGSFDIDFKWDKTPEGLKQALLEQTGLDLVPAKEPVEFLIVEDINHPVVGIGAALAIDGQTQRLKITGVYPNSPAAEVGVVTGAVIQKIDGVSVTDKTLAECASLIRGAEGTKVQLELLTPDGNTNAVELTRRKIQK